MRASLLVTAAVAAAQLPTATLHDAIYIGTTTRVASATAAVDKFLGIPYAATPERFRAARPRPRGSERVNATAQPPACIQQCKRFLVLSVICSLIVLNESSIEFQIRERRLSVPKRIRSTPRLRDSQGQKGGHVVVLRWRLVDRLHHQR